MEVSLATNVHVLMFSGAIPNFSTNTDTIVFMPSPDIERSSTTRTFNAAAPLPSFGTARCHLVVSTIENPSQAGSCLCSFFQNVAPEITGTNTPSPSRKRNATIPPRGSGAYIKSGINSLRISAARHFEPRTTSCQSIDLSFLFRRRFSKPKKIVMPTPMTPTTAPPTPNQNETELVSIVSPTKGTCIKHQF